MTQNHNYKFFARYADINGKLKHNLENIKKFVQKLTDFSEEIREEALKTEFTFFGNGNQLISVGDLNRIKETLEFNESKLIEVIDSLIEIINNENQAIHENLGKLKPDAENIQHQLDELLISYNQKKQRERTQFSELLGIVMEVAHDIIGIIEEEDISLANKFKDLYKNLIGMLEEDKGNSFIYPYFKSILEYLERLQKGGKLNTIKEHLTSEEKTFVDNFKRHNKENVIIKDFENLDVSNKTFEELGDKKDKVAKFMKKILKQLFEKGKKFNNKTLDQIIEVQGDKRSLIEEINRYYRQIMTIYGSEISSKKKVEDMKIRVEGIGRNSLKSFKDLNTDLNKFKEEQLENIKEAYENLVNDIDEWQDAFEREWNPKFFESTSHKSKKSDDKWFEDGEEFTSGRINEFISEAKEKIIGPEGIMGIRQIIVTDDAFEDGNLTEGARVAILDYKKNIILYLKSIGRNLKKFCDENGITNEKYLRQRIKDLIELFNNFSSKKDIENLLKEIEQFLNQYF